MSKKESHNTEYKQIWKEEYLQAICALANTSGGTLFVGKDDKGRVVGVANAKKLLTDIPSQIGSCLGFTADVELKENKSGDLIVIRVSKQLSPISYKGKYYVRSGSSTKELNGVSLQRFLLENGGQPWESFIEPTAKIADIDSKAISRFKALAASKLPQAKQVKSTTALLSKLRLIKEGKLTRAAVLLFGKDPQRFYPASYIRIGRFKDNVTPLGDEQIDGNLINQADKFLVVLKDRFLSHESVLNGLVREQVLEYPEAAIREAIVNSIVHRDYANQPSQVKVLPGQLSLWNSGELMDDLSVAKLRKEHRSHLRNPLIAEVLGMAGYVEKWGTGTLRMIEECRLAGLPEPIFEEREAGFEVTLTRTFEQERDLQRAGFNERQNKGISYLRAKGKISMVEYQKITKTSSSTATKDLKALVEKGVVSTTNASDGKTYYILQKGGVGDAKLSSQEEDELDKKLKQLKSEIANVDIDNEVQLRFDKNVFTGIYNTWLTSLMKALIKQMRKFDDLFTDPSHHITIKTSEHNGFGGQVVSVSFNDKDENAIIGELKDKLFEKTQMVTSDTTVTIHAFFGTFKKGALIMPFGCAYNIEIFFDYLKYMVYEPRFYTEPGFVITNQIKEHLSSNENYVHVYFDDQGNISFADKPVIEPASEINGKKIIADFTRQDILEEQVKDRAMFRIGSPRLLHKPFTDEEIQRITNNFGNTIFAHIDYWTKKQGIR